MYALLVPVLSLLLLMLSSTLQTKNPDIENGKPTQKAEKTENSSHVPVSNPSAIEIGQQSTTTKEEQHKSEANKTVSKPLDWSFLIYLAITALIAYLTFRTLRAIQRQGHLMAAQLEEMRNAREQTITEMKNAGLQTDRLIHQAQTSAEAAKQSIEAFKNAERPWIVVKFKGGINDGSFRQRKDGTYETLLYFEWFLMNVGRTPAFVFEIRAYLEIKTLDEIELLRQNGDIGKPLRPDKFIVAPRQTHDCPGITKINYWTDNERAAVFKHDAFLVAYGAVKYRNTLEGSEIHETPFIALYAFADGGYKEFLEGNFRPLYDSPAFNAYS